MQEINFTIHAEPYGKGRPRFTKAGHTYTPKKTRDYEKLVQREFISQAGAKKLSGAVAAEIIAVFKIPKSDSKAARAAKLSGEILPTKKPDCDNIAKTVLDALNGLAYDDDSRIISLQVHKRYDETGKVIVNLSQI